MYESLLKSENIFLKWRKYLSWKNLNVKISKIDKKTSITTTQDVEEIYKKTWPVSTSLKDPRGT